MTNEYSIHWNGDESVVEFAAVCLKETFGTLFYCWERAITTGRNDQICVHELRVASRRAESAVRLFADWLPQRKAERLLGKLDALRKSAGPARDCDVFSNRLAEVSGEPESTRFGDHLNAQRLAAQATLVAFHEECERGDELEKMTLDLIRTLRPRNDHSGPETLRFADWAPRHFRKAIREFFDCADVDFDDLESLHAFRIRAKQFRYMLELVSPALHAGRLEKAAVGLKKLSQRLGEINDHAGAIEILAKWMETEFDSHSVQMLRQWRKEERRALRRSIMEFATWWTPRRRRQLRRRLKQATKTDVTMTPS